MVARRPDVVAVRLTRAEIERLDVMRGDLSRSQYLRKVLASDAKRFRMASENVINE